MASAGEFPKNEGRIFGISKPWILGEWEAEILNEKYQIERVQFSENQVHWKFKNLV